MRTTKPFALASAIASAATLIAGVSAAGNAAAASADGGKACGSDKQCFAQRFADCKQARFTSEMHADTQVRYRTLGRQYSQCVVEMRYLANPHADWVDKPLIMVLNPSELFAPQFADAVDQCLGNAAPMDYQCSGALSGARTWRAAKYGDGPIPEVEAQAGPARHRAAQAPSQTPAGPPCGKTVKVTGQPLYAMPRNGRWGYVTRAGDWVIEPRWSQAEPFSEGRAAVSRGNAHGTTWGVIDRSGEYVVKPVIPSHYAGGPRVPKPPIKPFSEGCAAVNPAASRDYHYSNPHFLTRDGGTWLRDDVPKAIADLDAHEFGSMSDGLAWFRVFADSRKEYGYIDARGHVAIEVNFWSTGDFVDGLAPVNIENNRWGYIDHNGELAWPHKWFLKHARAFSQGLALIETPQSKKAYFDGDKIAIDQIRFEPPRTFENADGEKTVAVAPIEYAGGFSSGLAPVALDGHPLDWLYMDKQGHAVFSPGANPSLTVCYRSRNIDAWFRNHRLQFRHGLARLRVANDNGECGEPKKIANGKFVTYAQSHLVYIDTHGHVVLEEPFRDGDTDARPQPRGYE